MNVFILGAGKPAHGNEPSALKHIANNTRVIDWQIDSFATIADPENIYFLGGYHVDTVIKQYQQLNIVVVPDWENQSVLHTLTTGPLHGGPLVVSYSDTLFRSETISKVASTEADIVFGVDTMWTKRFDGRDDNDIKNAETFSFKNSNGETEIAEFTGLIKFSDKAVKFLSLLDEEHSDLSLLNLIEYMERQGLSACPVDVVGNWAELNSPFDIANFILGTKADTLARLEPLVTSCVIGKQVSFTVSDWLKKPDQVLSNITSTFSDKRLVVRSSSKGEDNWFSSNAGKFDSILNVDCSNVDALKSSIKKVISTYGDTPNELDQVLVQEFLQNVRASGVIFTSGLETGSPYYRINFDDKTSSTESVTSGISNDLRTVIISKFGVEHIQSVEPKLIPVVASVRELETLLGFDKLDIEFAVADDGQVHIFQVRPITIDHSQYEVSTDRIKTSLQDSVSFFKSSQSLSPFCYGEKTLFANMPDWNPAEIIGSRPKPLAFSLYDHIITNEIWAHQRAEFGYKDIRPHPLLVAFSGQPYVDVRASINSFIPANLSDSATQRIANAYIEIMTDNPHFHDKLEFEVAFTAWEPGLFKKAKKRLSPYGVLDEDIANLEEELKLLTRNAITRLKSDISSLPELHARRENIKKSNLPALKKALYLLQDCKEFGTLAFSHAARAGFVAMTLLKGFVEVDIITEAQQLEFLKSFKTVAGDFEDARASFINGNISLDELVAGYGHLRPGTYEITTPAYWEHPDQYFGTELSRSRKDDAGVFSFTNENNEQFRQVLVDMGADFSPQIMLKYIQDATESRESVKFEFTKNLSLALSYITDFGKQYGISRTELSFTDIADLDMLNRNMISISDLKNRIKSRVSNNKLTELIELPPIISKVEDFYCFERLASQPNFITLGNVSSAVEKISTSTMQDVEGKIVLIPFADPGYDWLFGRGVIGLITKQGGANSHMAIRAAELDLPAAIGVGDKMYEKLALMKYIELDCANQTIREVV